MRNPINGRSPSPRRHASTQAATLPPRCVRLVVDAASAITLRQIVMRTCGDAVRFLRVDACARSGKVTAFLCVSADHAATVCKEIARFLPDCECTHE